jgi:2-polyprenyl-6-methoxyphenol hydroxylase-like FAD-dependent oxidoreductase
MSSMLIAGAGPTGMMLACEQRRGTPDTTVRALQSGPGTGVYK